MLRNLLVNSDFTRRLSGYFGTNGRKISHVFCQSRGDRVFAQTAYANQIDKVIQKMEKMGNHCNWFIFLSGSVSFPPFFVVTVCSALLKIRFVNFFIFGAAGRFIRFIFCVGFPQLLKNLWV